MSTVLVTGGNGFLGQHVVREFASFNAKIVAPRRQDCDLRDASQIRSLFRQVKPDIVIHLAAVVGGIEANRKNPGRYFYENALMGLNLLEECRLAGIPKVICVGTCCSYPKMTAIPFKECDLFRGEPESTNLPYGMAKRMLIVQAQAYQQQYGLNAVSLIMANLFGPGDNFNPENSHVIPALIRKACSGDATVWGSGTASREFLFVRDAARAIRLATEHYDSPEPVNIGTGQEVTIRELAETIYGMCGCREPLAWDASKPDGQPRRCLDVSRAKSFGFTAETSLRDGLIETIEWWKRQR